MEGALDFPSWVIADHSHSAFLYETLEGRLDLWDLDLNKAEFETSSPLELWHDLEPDPSHLA